ncbi:MAG: flagellar biosynthesis protein FlhF [Syntrophales bacterium]|nr:flagellar biosynthesis protein FlhF [Syntrophales bacterium]MDD5231828.1 flagellar biosynthesis protein FlhF [Syntrophales bacterium]
MQVKRYEASNVQEAMEKIRTDLGDDAVVLSTKRLRRGKTTFIEVTAARDLPVKACSREENRDRTPASGREEIRAEIDEIRKIAESLRGENPFRAQMSELKEMMSSLFDLVGSLREETGLSAVYRRLVSGGMSRERAYGLVKETPCGRGGNRPEDYEKALRSVEESIGRSIAVPRDRIDPDRVVVFIGPTGVGKTTTLAKVAARYAIDFKKKVGLITTDTYRIAAAEQIRTYAKIMGLPLEIATEKESYRKALAKFSDKDCILVDTPGRSHLDSRHLKKIAEILAADTPARAHLLLSLTSSTRNLLEAADRYSTINYDSIIFTKLDETRSFGAMFDVVAQSEKPVSYLTTGQNVPKDIERANPDRIAKLIVGHGMN